MSAGTNVKSVEGQNGKRTIAPDSTVMTGGSSGTSRMIPVCEYHNEKHQEIWPGMLHCESCLLEYARADGWYDGRD